MISKRRQSSSYAEELFEFVDYTSVSNFERLVTAIEEILLSWGVKDGSYGVFSETTISSHKKSNSQSNTNGYALHESISVGDEAYKLTYYYQPVLSLAELTSTTKYPFSYDDFYLFNPPQVSTDTSKVFHPLHRWTGVSRFFILTPVSDSLKSKLFSSSKIAVDIHKSKYLISACSTAFNNLHCSIPIFIQTGQPRYNTFNGYMFQQNGIMDLDIRFDMTSIPPPNIQCHMCDFLDLFTQKLDIHRFNNGIAPLTLQDKQNILTGAAFTYNLKNWFDENWKQWDDTSDILLKSKNKTSRSENNTYMDLMDSIKTLPPLPFGSYNDPLRTLTLSTIFPLSNNSKHIENELSNNMDALTAKFWIITRELAQLSQQRGYLSTLLNEVISSWVRDPSNRDYLAPYDSDNLTMDDAAEKDSGLMRNLIHAVSQNRGSIPTVAQTGQITFMKTDQVEDIINAVFDLEDGRRYSGILFTDYISLRDSNKDISLFTSQSLGLRLKYGSIAPWNSFLWKLFVYGLHAFLEISNVSGSSSSLSLPSSSTSYMGFLRILWTEVLRRIRWHWEHLIPIPNVDPHLYHPSSTNNEEFANSDDTQNEDTLGIDLRYNIVHQKLTMLNCCIHQRLKEAKINKDSKHTHNAKKPSSKSMDKDNMNNKLPDTLTDFLEEMTDIKKEALNGSEPNSDISDSEMFFDSMEDIENIVSIKKKSTKNNHSCSSSISDASEVIPPTSMNESFVRLNYSSSADSDQFHQESNDFGDIDDWLGVTKESEISEPDIFEGRSHQHKSILLLKTSTPLWVPITQNPGFMTEDMIQQQADVFESLGTSINATKLRAKLQSAQLYSDMQAFKAANPHSVLEDFVRWHSPKDWIESLDGSTSGHLSSRMSQPTNIWQELWRCSKRIPASRQRSLFNLNAEGEKALHYLESLPVYEMFSSLLPTLGVIMYDTLVNHPIVKYIGPVSMGIKKLGDKLINFQWDALKNGKISFDEIINCIKKEESHMCSAISLLRKFPCQYDLVERLLQNSQTQVCEGDEREVVFNLYKNEYGGISKPSYKEFIFYMNNSNNLDTPLPQRQYVLLNGSELRIVDMYSIDGRYC